MRKLLLVLAYLCPATFGFSQSTSPDVITTAGDHHENVNGSVSWTIGEGVTETLEGTDIILTQGFQQSRLIVTAVKEFQNLKFEISAFPNPATDFITLKVESKNLKRISYFLFDVNGKFLIKNKIISSETEIPFTDYASSSYFLKVYYGKKEVKTFKIIKHNNN